MTRRGNRPRRNRNGGAFKPSNNTPSLSIVPRNVGQGDVHRFMRTRIFPLPTDPVAGGYPMALAFRLSDLPNFSDFTSLFDQYAIDRVDLSLVIGNVVLQVISSQDFDDDNLPASAATLLERATAEVVTVGAGSTIQFSRSIRPCIATEVFNSLVSTGYGRGKPGTLIDSANPNVPHFGYKFWFSPCAAGATSPTANAYIAARYHLRCVGAW